MWREIALTAEEKPVIVSMGDLAASGGYWIATAGDTILADPLTLTGSIGVFSIFLDAGGLFENKLGITFDAVRTSPYADMFSGVRPLNESERALLAEAVSRPIPGDVQLTGRDGITRTLDEIRADMDELAGKGFTELFIDLNFDPEIGSPDADATTSLRRADEVLDAFAPGA